MTPLSLAHLMKLTHSCYSHFMTDEGLSKDQLCPSRLSLTFQGQLNRSQPAVIHSGGYVVMIKLPYLRTVQLCTLSHPPLVPDSG